MADNYVGSTAASSVSNPPRCLVPRFAGAPNSTQLSTAVPSDGGASPYRTQGGALWLYSSSHLTTDITTANFFTDAWYIGMRPGDIVMTLSWTTAGSSMVFGIGALSAVSTAGAALSTLGNGGGYITSTF